MSEAPSPSSAALVPETTTASAPDELSPPSTMSSSADGSGVSVAAARSAISRFSATAEKRMVAPLSRSPFPVSVSSEAAGASAASGGPEEAGAVHGDWNPPTGMLGTAVGEEAPAAGVSASAGGSS
ncbi:hypothetical protein [Streptomyces sp. TRM68416]|uniref:hypothetical protein n=1 Tax=Streptomyces sp. TRM68416 TaxID=2758412 RepID=UPI00397FEDAE